MTTTLATDHPGWLTGLTGEPVRLVIHHNVPWLAHWQPAVGLVLRPLGSDNATAPPTPHTAPHALPTTSGAVSVAQRFATLGTVHRLTNPSLWDAVTTAILRQVVRAEQARKVHRRWCLTHGRAIETPAGPLSLVPDPETVLALPDEAFGEAGTAFHRSALRAAAAAYGEHHDMWEQFTPEGLVKALIEVPRIGPWTASAAAADYTGDFSIYPHGDLAVRTWARRALPSYPFPDTDREFTAHWRHLADEDRTQLHALTLFALTWGNHARTNPYEHATPSEEHSGVEANPLDRGSR